MSLDRTVKAVILLRMAVRLSEPDFFAFAGHLDSDR